MEIKVHRADYFWAIPEGILMLLAAGCGTMSNGRGWGQDAFSSPSLEKVSQAAYKALVDWKTLAPAAGALLFTIDHWDDKVADWAVNHRPLYGSENAARRASDNIYTLFFVEAFTTAMATPSGEDSKDWFAAKAKGVSVEALALGSTGLAILGLRENITRYSVDRTRDNYFPSGHASLGLGCIVVSNRNLENIPVPDTLRTSVTAGNAVLFTAMAWGRIEGAVHHPTDILAGAALGNFLTNFFHNAFMNAPDDRRFGVGISPKRGGALGYIFFSF